MTEFKEFHKIITAGQLIITLVSLCLSSLGAVMDHPYLINFWYVALFNIAMILVTSVMIGIALLFNRLFSPRASKREAWVVSTGEKCTDLGSL
jgi:lysylphosphatidylglycerol synthetase-like protein (DUF2156 family)